MLGATEVYTAQWGVIGGTLLREPRVVVREGIITALAGEEIDDGALLHDLGPAILLPGFVNAHSHAFQRGIRGATHHTSASDPSNFWTWRQAMYGYAGTLDPDGLYSITRLAYEEMLRAGITCVGEFHYLHHQRDGAAYSDPNELSWQVVRAATDVGIRLVLLEVYYARGGPDRPLLPEQRRFADGSLDAYLRRVEELRHRKVEVGLAPHSIRAVPAQDLAPLAAYARTHGLPLHAHVSEQRAENDACRQELGVSPIVAFAEAGCLEPEVSFTAVHATHIEPGDIPRLAGQMVCVCPTTEADLGDGLVPASPLFSRGVELALGSDSNAVIDLVQEGRLLEMHERLRTESRSCLRDDTGKVSPVILDAMTTGGARSLRRMDLGRLAPGCPFDACTLDLSNPFFDGIAPEFALDAALLAGTSRLVDKVFVGGRRVI